MKLTREISSSAKKEPADRPGNTRSDRTAPRRMAGRLELSVAVDSLMLRFCERRALEPLQILLRAYPGPLWHPYHKLELLETLENLVQSCPSQLHPEELELVGRLLALLRPSAAPPVAALAPSEPTALSI